MALLQEIAATLVAVKAKKPLIHHLTNYVTANDSANITLAFGASPVMAGDIGEVEEMVSKAGALVLNIGTLSAASVDAMIVAARKAHQLGIPVVFDPVGVGATSMRTAAAARIIRETSPAVIRGNASEIKVLAGISTAIRGVDSVADETDSETVARDLARKLGCVVALTGKTDIIARGDDLCRIDNGHPWLSGVTGTGCMATSLVGCCLGGGADPFVAAAGGITVMGIAGELAREALRPGENIGMFRVRLFDAVAAMTPETIIQRGKIT